MSKENPLDDSNAFTAGWSRPKMLHALKEMLPYFTDVDLVETQQQIIIMQKQRELRQQKLFKPPGDCMNTDKEENRKMREKIVLYTQGEQVIR